MSAPRKTFRDAACVVLVRGQGADLEVFWVRRSDAVPFQPGFMAFPGGKVDAADLEFDVPGVPDDFERAARVCAVREALEETGVLVAHEGEVAAASLAAARESLLAGRATLANVVREHGWKLAPESLTFAGRWQTPVFAPVRFDTLFFLSRLPFGQDASIIPGELASVTGLSRPEAGRGNRALVAEGYATMLQRGVYQLSAVSSQLLEGSARQLLTADS